MSEHSSNSRKQDDTEKTPDEQQSPVFQQQGELQQTKWICEYCTYENYPQSLKCTMCKGQKPLLNEDIFRCVTLLFFV